MVRAQSCFGGAAIENDSIAKSDWRFIHLLGIHDARCHLPILRSIVAKEFPNIPSSNLGIKIDYTTVPPKYDVFRLDTHDLFQEARTTSSGPFEARSESILEKARKSSTNSLIESKVCHGETATLVMTLTARNIWEDDEAELVAGFEDDWWSLEERPS